MRALFVLVLSILALSACAGFGGGSAPPQEEAAIESEAIEPEQEPLPATKPHIVLVSIGGNHNFGEQIKTGARDTTVKYGITMSFFDIEQGDKGALEEAFTELASASALCISSTDLELNSDILRRANENGLAIVGFDAGVQTSVANPEALYPIVATDSYAAGVAAAESMFLSPIFVEKMRNASSESKAVIAVLSEVSDGKEGSDKEERSRGFTDKVIEKAGALNRYGVYAAGENEMGAIVIKAADTASEGGASVLLQETNGLVGVFCVGQAEAEALIDAAGADLDKARGKYKDLTVIGFDAGEKQKNAVRNKYFYGAIAQNPYMMGRLAIEMAYNALQGDKLPETLDTGHVLYTYENMDRNAVSPILYD